MSELFPQPHGFEALRTVSKGFLAEDLARPQPERSPNWRLPLNTASLATPVGVGDHQYGCPRVEELVRGEVKGASISPLPRAVQPDAQPLTDWRDPRIRITVEPTTRRGGPVGLDQGRAPFGAPFLFGPGAAATGGTTRRLWPSCGC